MTVVPGWRAAASSTFSVTVSPRSVSTIARGRARGRPRRWPRRSRGWRRRRARRPCSADRCGSTVRVPRSQPPAYGSSKRGQLVQQRAEEHDDGAGAAGGVDVDAREVEAGRGDDLEVVAVGQPAHPDADRGEHLDDPVDLLDAGQAAQRGAALVEQAGAEQGDGGVLARLDRDRAGQLAPADDPQVLGAAVAERDELAVELLADPGEHLEARGSACPARCGRRRSGWCRAGRRARSGSGPGGVGRPGSGCRSGSGRCRTWW